MGVDGDGPGAGDYLSANVALQYVLVEVLNEPTQNSPGQAQHPNVELLRCAKHRHYGKHRFGKRRRIVFINSTLPPVAFGSENIPFVALARPSSSSPLLPRF